MHITPILKARIATVACLATFAVASPQVASAHNGVDHAKASHAGVTVSNGVRTASMSHAVLGNADTLGTAYGMDLCGSNCLCLQSGSL